MDLPHIGLASDTGGNIYYTLKDTVYSISGTEPYALRWKRHHSSAAILDVQHLHVDNDNRLFVFGSRNATFERGIVLTIDPANGDLLSNVIATPWGARFNAMTEDDSHLYITWKPISFGQYTGWWTTKVDKATGAIAWSSSYNLDGEVASTTLDTDREMANGVVLDADGNVLLTGLFDGGSIVDGKWGILKLDGTTGTRIYEKLVPGNLPDVAHRTSGGVSIYRIGDNVCAVGNLQTYRNPELQLDASEDRSTPALITVDPASGEILMQSHFYGEYEFPSQILAMQRFGEDIIVLKQIGRSLRLGRYDLQQNSIWEKTITQQYLLKSAKMHLTESGKIAIAALKQGPSPYDPYFDNDLPDAVATYLFDADGTEISSNNFPRLASGFENMNTFHLIDVYTDDNSLFVFFAKDQQLRLRKVDAASFSSEVAVDISLHSNGALPYVFDDTGGSIRVAGMKNGIGPRVISFDKSTMAGTVAPFIYPLSDIASITKLNADEFIISGRDSKSQNFIMRYNLTLSQTVWTTVLGNAKARTYKQLLNSDSTFLVTLGADDNYTALRKIDFSTGAILDSHINTTVGITNIPTDAVINETTDEVVFSGYAQPSTGTADRSIMVGSVALSNLAPRQIHFYNGGFSGHNTATTIEVASDNTNWIGGNRNISGLHKAAFIYRGSLAHPATDTRPPLLRSNAPSLTSSLAVKPTTPLELTFDEDIVLGSGMLNIFNSASDALLAQIPITSANTNISGATATITPASPLPPNVSIYIKIDPGTFKDLAGNIYPGNQDESWAILTDDKAPLLSSKAPTAFTPGIRLARPLELNFNENIFLGTGSIRIYQSSGAALVSTTNLSDANTKIEGKKVIVIPDAPFPPNTSLYVNVDQGAFLDAAGNSYAGISNTSWSFFTPSPDTQAPQVTNLIPNVSSTANPSSGIQISFNEQVVLNTGSLYVYDSSTDALLQTIDVTPDIVNILAGTSPYITPPLPLPEGRSLYIKADHGLFQDLEGNSFDGIQDKSWSFSTDFSPDLFVATIPAPDAADVSPYVTLVIEFTETVIANHGRGSISIHDYNTDILLMKFNVSAANTIFSTNRVFVTLPAPLPSGKHVYVNVNNGAFRTLALDPAGSNFDGITPKQWHFRTIALPDTQAPLLASWTPADDATNVSVSTTLQLDFSEDIMLGSGNIRIIDATTDEHIFEISLNSSNTSISAAQATITLPNPLPASTMLYVNIDNGAFKDFAGNAFEGIQDERWTFTTIGSDNVAPIVISTFPARLATSVDPTDSLVITFSEPVILAGGQVRILYYQNGFATTSSFNLDAENTVISGNSVTITPDTPLPSEATVYVLIDEGVFTDPSNNHSSGTDSQQTWVFTTAVLPDQDAPFLVSTIPAGDAFEENPVKSLTLRFNEPVTLQDVSLAVLDFSSNQTLLEIELNPSNTSIDGSAVTVTLPEPLPADQHVYVQITMGEILDVAGNKFAGLGGNQWNFHTPLITGIENSNEISGLHITLEDNYVRIHLQNTNLKIRAINDVLGRPIDFEQTEADVIFVNPEGMFMVQATNRNLSFVFKMRIMKP